MAKQATSKALSKDPMPTFSKDFTLDSGIFKDTKLTLSASLDTASQAIVSNTPFPDGNIQLGQISFAADTGQIALKPESVGGTDVKFQITASAQSGMGLFGKSADALASMQLQDTPSLKIPDAPGQRFLLLEYGYSGKFSGEASHPIGMLGTVTFGVDAAAGSKFGVLHRFDNGEFAHDIVQEVIASWRMPRHIDFNEKRTDLNIRPCTWIIAEADGSLALKLAASLGWNMSFAKDAKLLGVTHNLSAKLDASLKATFGFNVSGKYVVVAGREDEDPKSRNIRLQLYKQKSNGLDFGLNLNVGFQAKDAQLPDNFDDFIQSTFGVHGLQVLKDVRTWTDPSTDLGQKIAGLTDETAKKLLKNANPAIDPEKEFDKAKAFVGDVLNKWDNLPGRVSTVLWNFIGKKAGTTETKDFKDLLTAVADPTKATEAVKDLLAQAKFGDDPGGQFLEAAAEQGLLVLLSQLQASSGVAPINAIASKALELLNGGVIANLQQYINQALNLDQIRKVAADADFSKVDQWLQNRLATFIDKQLLKVDDFKDIRAAIQTLDSKVKDYYAAAVEALQKRYNVEFAATYQKTTTDTALIDVTFDFADPNALAMYGKVVGASNLDELLTKEVSGVTLGAASLSHEIKRTETVDLHMPFFDFTSKSVNDSMVNLKAENQGAGRLLVYQIDAKDSTTIKNRTASQLSVMASLRARAGRMPEFDPTAGAIAYEMRQVKARMLPDDLEERTRGFVEQYLGGLFGAGETSMQTFYTNLDRALTAATGSQSNQLGDTAIAMQLALPVSVLGGWFEPRSGDKLRADQRLVSQSLQIAWKKLLPAMFFQNLSHYQFNPATAAMLVWSSLPVSTSLDRSQQTEDPPFSGKPGVFWNWPDHDVRQAVVRLDTTVGNLVAQLVGVRDVLKQEGRKDFEDFGPVKAGRFIQMALEPFGDGNLQSLLKVEERLVEGAGEALKDLSEVMNSNATAAVAPSVAIRAFSEFAGALTETFHRLDNIYAGLSSRVLGSMLLVEASRALGSAGAVPAALLNLYALKPGHTFNLGDFVEGTMPPQAEVALTQTLISAALP